MGFKFNTFEFNTFEFNTFRYEPLWMNGSDGNKYDHANYEKMTPDGKVSRMTEDEAKRHLGPDGYKKYRIRNKR